MSITITDLGKADPSDQLRLALVGLEQSGKSRLAATCRKPALHFDYDGKKASIAGTPGLFSIDFKESVWPNMPTVYPDSLDLLAKLEKSLDLHLIFPSVAPETFLKTVILDSAFSFGKAVMRYGLFHNKDMSYVVSMGGKSEVRAPKSWAGWNAETTSVEEFLIRLFALGIDVIFILHETDEESKDSTEESPKFTGRQTVYPVRYNNLLKYFNEVWRITRTDKNPPKVQTVPDYKFLRAGTTLLVDASEEPNIEAMIQKHKIAKSKKI